jgi:restriction system protein
MAIPDFETFMLPTLNYAADKQEHSVRETIDYLARKFTITQEERKELLPSGENLILNNRISWTLFYLRKAGPLESTRRGFYRITQTGLQTLSQKPSKVDTKYLQLFPPFQEFISAKSDKTSEAEEKIATTYSKSPEESLDYSYQMLREVLIGDLLIQIKNSSPDFFERLVVGLLVRIGYGGSKEAGKVIGRSGDEGIDGTIKEDVLG